MRNNIWRAYLYIFILLLITVIVEYANYKEYTYYQVECFAVDSMGRVFIGKKGKIDIYDNNFIVDTVELPISHSYNIKLQEDNIIQILKNSDIYYIDLSGKILNKETSMSQINMNFQEVNTYVDKNGNVYEYSDTIFSRKKIIKNGYDTIFVESRFNQIASIIKKWQFFEFLLALCMFAGKGHPVAFIRVAAKRLSSGKVVYFNKFDDYYKEYYDK